MMDRRRNTQPLLVPLCISTLSLFYLSCICISTTSVCCILYFYRICTVFCIPTGAWQLDSLLFPSISHRMVLLLHSSFASSSLKFGKKWERKTFGKIVGRPDKTYKNVNFVPKKNPLDFPSEPCVCAAVESRFDASVLINNGSGPLYNARSDLTLIKISTAGSDPVNAFHWWVW